MRTNNQKYNNHMNVGYYDILRKVSPDIWSVIYMEYKEANDGKQTNGDTDKHLLDFFKESKEVQETFCACIKSRKISPSVFSFISGIEASIPYGLSDQQLKSIITTFANVINRAQRSTKDERTTQQPQESGYPS